MAGFLIKPVRNMLDAGFLTAHTFLVMIKSQYPVQKSSPEFRGQRVAKIMNSQEYYSLVKMHRRCSPDELSRTPKFPLLNEGETFSIQHLTPSSTHRNRAGI